MQEARRKVTSFFVDCAIVGLNALLIDYCKEYGKRVLILTLRNLHIKLKPIKAERIKLTYSIIKQYTVLNVLKTSVYDKIRLLLLYTNFNSDAGEAALELIHVFSAWCFQRSSAGTHMTV